MKLHLGKRECEATLAAALATVVVLVSLPVLLGCNSGDSSQKAAHATLSPEEISSAKQFPLGDLSDELIDEAVRVEGKVTRQCPAIGCWMIVKDGTGELFIDLKPATLELSENREGEQVRVAGRLAKPSGRLQLEAHSVEFLAGADGEGSAAKQN